MKGNVFNNKAKCGAKLLGLTFVLLAMISMLACVAAIPVIVYYESTKHYTATVQVNAKPQAVYQTAIRVIEGKPDVEIEKKDEAKLLVEADRGKKQSVSIHAASVDANKTHRLPKEPGLVTDGENCQWIARRDVRILV